MLEADFLFDKSYKCPVCGQDISSRTIRAKSLKRIGMDMSLRPRFEGIEPLKYDVISCYECGYTALSRFFNDITDAQGEAIRKHFSENPSNLKKVTTPTITYSEAVQRYQAALLNAIVKNAKESEKAYICLKMTWLITGMLEDYKGAPNYNQQIAEQYAQKERELFKHAYDGFVKARLMENFPICGMDENTVEYLIAYAAIKFSDFENAKRMLEMIITDKECGKKLKEMALELKKECV